MGSAGVMRRIRQWKHLALLIALVVVGVLEPLAAHWSERTQLLGGIIATLINIAVLLVVFERRWVRGLAVFLVALIFAATILQEVLSDRSQTGVIAFHCVTTVYLAFAVAIILKRIFQQKSIGIDDVIGALCGYILAGGAWGNIYGLVYLIWPASFRITDAVASQFGNWHLQRFFFDYFSILTLTTNGYSDIAPAGWPVYSLVLFESVFGQFYIAVVVAQLVSQRLAQAIKPDSSDAQ